MAEYDDVSLLEFTPDTPPGTLVVCVNDGDGAFQPSLIKGKVYKLKSIKWVQSLGEHFAHIENDKGADGGWSLYRFEIA